MSLYKQFQTDKELERNGIEVNYGPNSKGQEIIFTIARAGGANEDYSTDFERTMKPHRRALQTETMNRKLFERLVRGVFARTVVKGVKNLEDENGNALEPTAENVEKVLADLPELYNDLQDIANKSVAFRKQILEADAGN